jgi:hypothetical protein
MPVRWQAQAASPIVMKRTTNLLEGAWSGIATVTLDRAEAEIDDPEGAAYPSCFYRADVEE